MQYEIFQIISVINGQTLQQLRHPTWGGCVTTTTSHNLIYNSYETDIQGVFLRYFAAMSKNALRINVMKLKVAFF